MSLHESYRQTTPRTGTEHGTSAAPAFSQAASLAAFLERSAAQHRHLCPRQVLGVRMGMLAAALLRLGLPQEDKRLLTIAETDGCAIDGITAVTGCSVGHRTLRVEDYGKIAATFIDTESGRAVRVVPRNGIRQEARLFAPDGANRWEQQLLGYQRMPDDVLLRAEEVALTQSIRSIVSRAGQRKECAECGEEIMNERWVDHEGAVLCRACVGPRYYDRTGVPEAAEQ